MVRPHRSAFHEFLDERQIARWSRLTLVVLLPFTNSCTLLLDRDVVQCRTNSDCARFESASVAYAVCSQGVCVNSGLGPEGCVASAPTSNLDYLNACTTSQYLAFDNCTRLGICTTGAVLPDPVAPQQGTATASVTPTAAPTVRCADAGPNVIYMTGAADFPPLLAQVTPLLAANGYRGVFFNGSSCSGVSSVFDPTASIINDVPGTPTTAANYAFYYDDSGTQVNCTLDPGGKPVDIGVSDLFSTECGASYVPGSAVAEYLGPVVTFGIIVAAASQEMSISAEAAHLVFGLGGQNPSSGVPATPWTNYQYYSIRNSGAAAVALTAGLISVPRTGFWGIDRLSPANTATAVMTTTEPEQAIGLVSINYADTNRHNLRALYLQSTGQLSGFLPDSSPTALDKANVRDGHYQLWGYVHFYTANLGGNPSPAAAAFVTGFSVPDLNQSLVTALIAASLVPQCAMKVERQSEMGPVGPNTYGFQCGCFFDSLTTGHAACPPCKSNNDCPPTAPSCNYGFCETT